MAVIGPNADQWQMLLGNYNGLPSKAYTPLEGIRAKLGAAHVLYAPGCELAEGLRSRSKQFRAIGDCLSPRHAPAAIYEGRRLGLEI